MLPCNETGETSGSHDVPDCIAIDEVDQQALFRRGAAVVHHGAGTTTTAAAVGTPQAVLPHVCDQSCGRADPRRRCGSGRRTPHGVVTAPRRK
ncbi:nucleotide disphospho-sugar-binding domain-containing protein [Lentzea jiangxiensis]|uniref:nucleotide disphospho-sugar-binding domain-containing protein n=1 Tax=Lentzea jiangxiensis TaxID=641025 RepID=UPI00316AEA88